MAKPGTSGVLDLDDPVARDLAALDWTGSALGPPERWPLALRTALRLMLASQFSMWLGWGPDLLFFCNDAYRRDTLGERYPRALGRPAAEVWSELWDELAPRAAQVLAGEATWDESLQLFMLRHGRMQETYHTFSYSPIVGDDGAVGGLFCVVTEDTRRVVAERRMATLRDLGTALGDAVEAADIAHATVTQLARNPYDVPFAIAYDDRAGDGAQRQWSVGLGPGSPLAPAASSDAPWPAGIETPRVVPMPVLAEGADLPTGGWEVAPREAIVLPLGQPGLAPTGRLVVGINPFRPLDADYLGFLELLAGQVASSRARAAAFEDERRRGEQLAELDRAKTTFFTNVSHELRTPLTLLLGPVEDALLDDAAPLPARQRERVTVVQRNAERLLKLVTTLLDFSRLEAGRTEARFEPCHLGALTTELADLFRATFDSAGLGLRVQVDPGLREVHVDREMWSKIVLNLISNALKATFTGGVEVIVDDDPDGRGVRLRVIDTGVGIAADQHERLFERFHRVAGAALRTHEGSGIGLALVAELTQLHGGTVSVNSALGEGTTFTITMPYGTDHLPADQVAVAGADPGGTPPARVGAGFVAEARRWLAPSQAAPAGTSTRPRVLVVDDNADMRDHVTGLLQGHYAVDTAVDGLDALARVRAQPPQLVLTDVMMPGLDGFGLLRALRRDPATAHLPVVMLSARSGDEATVDGLDAGADDYLVKPFSGRELVARVRANLEMDRVRRLVGRLERARDILDHAEQLAGSTSWELDLVDDRLTASAHWAALFGTGPDPDAGGTDTLLAHVRPEDRPRVHDAIRAHLDGAAPIDVEVRAAGGGSPRLLRIRAAAVLEPDETPPAPTGPDAARSPQAAASTARDTVDTVDIRDGDAGDPARGRRPEVRVVLRGSTQDVTAQRAAEQQLAAAAADREAAAREHAVAQQLQRSLLPAERPRADHLEIAAYYRAGVAGTQVGGDWYDVIDLGGGRTALVLGDVMGRGVGAAAVMGQLRAGVRAYARLDLAPAELLGLLDGAVREMATDTIVTCVYAVHDPMQRTLELASAGHLPVVVTRPHAPSLRLGADGPPLGAGGRYTARPPLPLVPGTTLTLFTDGLVEHRGEDLADRVDAVEHLVTELGGLPVTAVPEQLTTRLLPGDAEDDVAVLVARVPAADDTDRHVRIDVEPEPTALADTRSAADAACRRWGLDAPLRQDVALVVSELTTNALRHGHPPVQVRMRLDAADLVVEVEDAGGGRARRRQAAPTDESGRGLVLVAATARRWGTRRRHDATVVWCALGLA